MDAFSYLGTSLSFPLGVNQYGRAVTVGGLDNIKQALLRLLSTEQGSRFFLPEYGSRLQDLVFEPNDEVLQASIRLSVSEAIETWEGRVRFIDVAFQADDKKPDLLNCTVSYTVLASNSVDSFVYPFYRKLIY